MAVYLHVGQCGIQTGNSFWRRVSSSPSPMSFTLPDGQLPRLLIDTDHRTCKLSTGKSAAGNWSNGLSNGKGLQLEVLDKIRKIAERRDCLTGFVIMHSLAGGTGSGLTSHLMECLRDEYSLQYILNISIWPFQSGEAPLQHYNSLLTLPYLQQYSDAAILFHNDVIMSNALKTNSSVDISMMNDVVGQILLNFTSPLHYKRSLMELSDIARSIAPLPQYKFATPNHVTVTRLSWGQAIQNALPLADKHQKLLSAIAVLQSSAANIDVAKSNIKSLEKRFKDHYVPVDWNPYPIDVWFRSQEKLHETKSLTTLTNSSSELKYFSDLRDKSKLMYQSKAYLHWYDESADFESSFNELDVIIQNYSSL